MTKKYDREFKLQTVRLIKEEGKPVAQVSREMGLHENTIYRWLAEFKQDGQGISIHQLKYWLRQMKRVSDSNQTHTTTTAWMPVTVISSPENRKQEPGVVIRIGQASIEVANRFDPHLLRQVVQTLMTLC